MKITFERATPADVETLVKVQVEAFNNDSRIYPNVRIGGPPGYESPDRMLQKMREEDYYKILADGQIVGGMGIFNLGQGHFHLDVIYIDPAYHSLGIGTEAMEFIERTYAAKKWTLNTPDYATRNHHFYEKFGYVMVGKMALENIILRDYEKYL